MRRCPLSLVLGLFLSLPLLALTDRPPYSPEQLTLLRTLSEACLAPDGQTVAFVSDATGVPELWTVPAAGGWPLQLTNLNERVANVRWSPDGRWLLFTSDYGGNERRDLYRVPAAGGAVEKLTDTPLSESEPRFSPDGQRIAFTADPDREFLFQLHVLDLQTRKTTQLTREAVNVHDPVWSPDGATLAVTRTGDDQKGELLLVQPATGKQVVVPPAVKDGIVWPEDFSPDGTTLLTLARNPAGFDQLALVDLAAPGPPVFIGPGDWDVTEARWTAAGIYFLRNEGGALSLNLLPSPRSPHAVLVPADGVLHQVEPTADGKRLSLLRETTTQPADVWIHEYRGATPVGTPRQVTFSLLGGVRPEELAPGKLVPYESFDGKTIHTLVLRPRVARLGTPPPAVVYVHGGPNGQTLASFEPLLHVLAEAGFVVLAPNYRGSTGYGKAFEDANNKDWGGGDLRDLVAAVKHFAGRGEIDPRRVGITGGSYGGYLTLMALCRTPEVWAAGVEMYGMPDLVMDYLLTSSRFGTWYATEMGNPRTDAALFRERSPLPYLEDIRAPLLVFQGAADSNVPRAESDLLVAVLRELKKPHEYIVYDDEGHGFTRRKNVLDCYRRTAAFFVQHLGARAR